MTEPLATEHLTPFSISRLEIVRFCAIECELQRSGERSVHWMLEAYNYALTMAPVLPTEADVLNLGRLVEPNKNADGYRQVPVRIGNDVKAEWRLIPRQMEKLCEAVGVLDPGPWFYEYEQVHPWRDGNGRTGQILYNWLNDTLHAPVWAPNYFDDPRRLAGDGA